MKGGAKVLARLFKLSGLEAVVSKQCKYGVLDELCHVFQRVKSTLTKGLDVGRHRASGTGLPNSPLQLSRRVLYNLGT
eukprot:9497321-Pyramimonas_sp.AAC.1